MHTAPVGRLDPLRRTMREWTTPQRVLAAGLAVLLTAALAAYYGHAMGDEFVMYDGEYYVDIARGDTAHSIQPFASRQLGALVVRALVALFHITINHGFLIQAIACMVGAMVWVFVSMSRTAAPRWLMAACVLLPFWRVTAHGILLPDIWYLAMLCVFLALLEAEHLLLAAAFLFPLMLSRESTTLVLVCFLLATWRRLGWKGAALAVVATAAASKLVGHLTSHIANGEHLPQSVYMLAKIPWNGVRLTGLMPWANLYNVCAVRQWEYPLHLGSLQAIGICSWSPDAPLACVKFAINTFGLLPALVFFLLRARRWKLGESSILRFAMIYGAVSFVLTPLLGTAYDRLFSYAWPLAVVALPRLWTPVAEAADASSRAMSLSAVAAFFVLHATICYLGVYGLIPGNMTIAFQAALFVAGCVILAGQFPVRQTVLVRA